MFLALSSSYLLLYCYILENVYLRKQPLTIIEGKKIEKVIISSNKILLIEFFVISVTAHAFKALKMMKKLDLIEKYYTRVCMSHHHQLRSKNRDKSTVLSNVR